jgi:FkbM family methyltransferase
VLKNRITEGSYRALEASLGRRNLVRIGRFLSNRARLDVPNDMRTNGELLVLERSIGAQVRGKEFVALDVGANVGEWTCALQERLSAKSVSSRIYAFEPVASTRLILERNLGQGPHASVTVVPTGLSNVARADVMFIVGDGAGTNSLHAGDQPPARTEEVAMDTVDAFCAREKIGHVDLMKVDTEGHDFAVLEGSLGMLGRSAIDVVQFEYNHRWVFARRFLRDVFAFLEPLRYRLGKVTPFGVEFYDAWHPELETFREGNYLACQDAIAGRFPAVRWWNAE